MLDVSKSMNVFDVRFQDDLVSRLDASKKMISDFISYHPENRYALTIFAGESERLLPFTSDAATYLTILSGVTNKNIS